MLTRELERLCPVRRDDHVITADLQIARNVLSHWCFVVCDENCGPQVGHVLLELATTGSVNTIAAPPPWRGSAQIRPFCERIMLRQIASPRPVPGLEG